MSFLKKMTEHTLQSVTTKVAELKIYEIFLTSRLNLLNEYDQNEKFDKSSHEFKEIMKSSLKEIENMINKIEENIHILEESLGYDYEFVVELKNILLVYHRLKNKYF